jgi:uncharacterized protein
MMPAETNNIIEWAAILRRILLLILTFYAIISGILYLFQNQLIFFKQGIAPGRLQHIREHFPGAEEVIVDTRDNTRLHGWLVHSGKEGPSSLLIYFGGNAEEVSWMIDQKNKFGDWSILLVNYRGYGLSGGRPGEEALLGDALLLYDTFSVREDINPDRIAIMGRSLGSAMAVYLSSNRAIAGSVLVSPFGSIEDIARSNFPFLPVSLLLKHKFNVLPLAAVSGNPMLTIIASDDTIIPPHHSERLFEAWKGEKELVVIENADHNNISYYSGFWEQIRDFLDSLP